jgi:thiamine-phosphate pyrophosphorylase
MTVAADILWQTAKALASEGPLPPLFFVTDPQRTPDPVKVAKRLPAGAGVIYRAFGSVDALETARRLREIAEMRSLLLLVGLDPGLAEASEAHGLHLPEHAVREAPRLRQIHPEWVLTGAAHGETSLRYAETARLDAALLSPVFESRSLSAGAALGLDRFSELARAAALPVYALGGVNSVTAPHLVGSGAAGIAAVEGLV